MFQIKPVPSLLRGSTLLLQGATFGYYNLPIKFIFTSDAVPKPVELSIVVIKDETAKPGLFMSDITVTGDSGTAELKIINPPLGNSTNVSKQQIAMLSQHRAWLGLNFFIAEFTNVKHFLFYYEFYEETIESEAPAATQKASTGAPV